jgi:hypothetical protein
MSKRTRLIGGAIGLGSIALIGTAYAVAINPCWTSGTTQAANQVVGNRSGLSFQFVEGNSLVADQLTVTATADSRMTQVINLSTTPPPIGDTPPPVGDRVATIALPQRPVSNRLDPYTIQIFEPNKVVFLDASGQVMQCSAIPTDSAP